MRKTAIKLLQELRFYVAVWSVFLIVCFFICFFQKEKIYAFITQPVSLILKQQALDVFIYTSIFENFSTDIALCAYSSLFLSLPVLIFCAYKFVAKSLFPHEKKIVKKLLFVAIMLAIISVCMTYYIIFPHAVEFFLNMQSGFAIPMLKISDYVSTFFHIILGISIIFQFPLIIVGLVRFGVIKPDFLSKNRRIAIVLMFVVGAIITPPDVISQVICAGLLLFLYELTNLYIKNSLKKNIKITKRKTNVKKNSTDKQKKPNKSQSLKIKN